MESPLHYAETSQFFELESSCSWIIAAIQWNKYDKLTFNLDHFKGAGQSLTSELVISSLFSFFEVPYFLYLFFFGCEQPGFFLRRWLASAWLLCYLISTGLLLWWEDSGSPHWLRVLDKTLHKDFGCFHKDFTWRRKNCATSGLELLVRWIQYNTLLLFLLNN